MSSIGNNFKSLFFTVEYDQNITKDNSWAARAEWVADQCREPGRWVAQLWGGGIKYKLQPDDEYGVMSNRTYPAYFKGWEAIARVVVGVVVGIFGEILALPFMGFALCASKEIRLKHKFITCGLSEEEQKNLMDIIKTRKG